MLLASYSGSDLLTPEIRTVTVTVVLPAAWSASKVYNSGDEVSYQGALFTASWYTQNQKPGDPQGPWQEIAMTEGGTALWTASRTFNTGDTVVYHGATYKADWYTRNQAPGDPTGPWLEVAPPAPAGSRRGPPAWCTTPVTRSPTRATPMWPSGTPATRPRAPRTAPGS